MKLLSFKVREFKCVIDSNDINVNDTCCLVGKNESGKTALLQALYRLNPIDEHDAKFNAINEYPRMKYTKYTQDIKSGEREPAVVVEARFQIEDNDIKKMALPGEIFDCREFVLSRDYDANPHFDIKLNENGFIKWSLDGIECIESEENSLLYKEIRECSSLQNLSEIVVVSYEGKPECTPLIQLIHELQDPNYLQEFYLTHIFPMVPKFLYFDEYYQMSGIVNIPELKKRVDENAVLNSDKPMIGLIELSGIDLNSIDQIAVTRELLSMLESGSAEIQKTIMNYWSQSKNMSLQITIHKGRKNDPDGCTEGDNIWTQIRDDVHWATTAIGERSRGFIWFFSFIAWFSSQKFKHDDNIILLLDEPGLTLHAKAQYDLLKYMEIELLPHHQVIYTTHSPFMIDMDRITDVAIVEDRGLDETKKVVGTKVTTNILETDRDSIFPLQGALGYDITQSLFVGPNCLIVEGPSDYLYLTVMSNICQRLGKKYLDPKWTITPVGGINKVPAFVSLFGRQKSLNIAVLIDYQSKDKDLIENLYKSKLLTQAKVKTFADFNDNKDSDIEDLFETDFYIMLINNEYKKELKKKIEAKDLNQKIPRIIKQIEKHEKKIPLKNGLKFNHYRPARYFFEKVGELEDKLSDETIDKFEEVFKAINLLLKKR